MTTVPTSPQSAQASQPQVAVSKQEIKQAKNQNHRLLTMSFVCGGIAGACAKTIIAPFERIKLLFVTRDRSFNYSEAIKETKYIFKKHGISNFWRGNSANLLRIFPFASINFSTFDFLRKTFYNQFPDDQVIMKHLLLFSIGAAAGIIAQSVCYPFEFLRTRLAMQRDHFEYKNFQDAVKVVYKNEGIKGFYSGMGLGIIGVIFYHGSGFFIVTKLKNHFKEKKQIQLRNSWYMDFLFGAFGSTIAQLISYPFDVMRKRRQAESLLISTGEQKHKMTYRELTRYYIKKEGIIPTFYKGITMNLIKGPLSSGTAWMVKNQLNRYFDPSYDL